MRILELKCNVLLILDEVNIGESLIKNILAVFYIIFIT